MLAAFCLRLALGLLAGLLLVSPKQLHPRFFRSQFLTALGLFVVAAVSAWETAGSTARSALVASSILALLGALSWTLESAPAGRALIMLTAAVPLIALQHPLIKGRVIPYLLDDLTSAALLGSALTAMLIGHSYLIAPGMALTPLLRMLTALFVSIGLRALVAGVGLWVWSGEHDLYNLKDETVLWLPVRWLVGLAGPLVFGWMAYAAAKIRATQSATGILYVAVICCFLGELLSLVLMRQTGLPL